MTTNGIHSIEENSIEENSIEKNSIEKNSIDNKIYGQNEGQNKGQNPLEEKIEVLERWETQFNEFYNLYPKKVKKQEVKKWFLKNKPSNELFSSMMNSLEQFRASKDWQKDGGQFIPYPSTWLNQKRWEDETIKQKSGFDDFIDMWKEAKDEEERNDTDNNTFSW